MRYQVRLLFVLCLAAATCLGQKPKSATGSQKPATGMSCVQYFHRGLAKDSLKDYRGAIADFSKALELNHKYAQAYNARAHSKAQMKDDQGAIADYTKVIELMPKFADAYFNRGRLKADLSDYRSAIEDYTMAIEAMPKYAEVYYWRGVLRNMLGPETGCPDLIRANELGCQKAYKALKEHCCH